MRTPSGSFPGSNSVKLTHDFCHIDSESSDDVHTGFSFVEMGGRTIHTESFQEDLWIWVSPCRFAIIFVGLIKKLLPRDLKRSGRKREPTKELPQEQSQDENQAAGKQQQDSHQ